MCRSYFSQTRSLRGTPPTHTQAARNQNEFKNNKARNHDLKRSRKPENRKPAGGTTSSVNSGRDLRRAAISFPKHEPHAASSSSSTAAETDWIA